MPNPAELFGLIVFGIVGSAALLIGKRVGYGKELMAPQTDDRQFNSRAHVLAIQQLSSFVGPSRSEESTAATSAL